MIKKSMQTVIVLGLAFLAFIWLFHQLLPQSDSKLKKKDFIAKQVQSFHYTALGDSLTEGIGDTSNQGGFVSILANNLHNAYGYQVDYDNFGIAGHTSKQILTRLEEEKELQKSVAQADLVTLTVGGNDVLTVIRKNLTNLTLDDFEQATLGYQKRLKKIIALLRKDNENLPIYILGIYNPFFLSFPEMTEMQEVIDNWNTKTQEVTDLYDNIYFVAINDIIYQGIEDSDSETNSGINNVLYEEDNFHPNLIGYRLMANAVGEMIDATKENWLVD